MNIVIYVCDALRADHIGCYGYARQTTPVLDRLARESVRFECCFAPATWTRPVAASIMTGLYPQVHKTRQRNHILNPALPRLSTILQQAGWYTMAVTAMSNVSKATGFDVGFDAFIDLYLDSDLIARRGTTDAAGEDFRLTDTDAAISLPWAEDVVEQFLTWHVAWQAKTEEPFFSLLWTIDTHIPYECPVEFRVFADQSYSGAVDGSRHGLDLVRSEADKQHLRDLYDNQIRYSDHNLGALVDYLKQAGLYDDTLLVVLGDHGEAFWEHGQFGHGLQPFDEVLRVPLIMKLPQQEEQGRVVNALTNLTDVFATVLATAGLEKDLWTERTQSKDLLPLIRDEVETVHPEATFSETQPTQLHMQQLSARTANWKYIETRSGNRKERIKWREVWHQLIHRGMWRRLLMRPLQAWRRWYSPDRNLLYDLSQDPCEQSNVYGDRPDIIAEMEKLLSVWEQDCREKVNEVHTESITSDLDPETWRQLKALGYVD